MTVSRPRSELVIAGGLVAFIAVALIKPWGSPARPLDPAPNASSAAVALPSSTLTARPTPSPIGTAQIGATITWVPAGAPPVGVVEADGNLWFAADHGRIVRIDSANLTTTEVGLDSDRFSGRIVLASDGVTLWVTGANDNSVGVLDTSSLEVDGVPANATDSVVIDAITGSAAAGGFLWFLADVHASQAISATPCCNGRTSEMLFRADPVSRTVTGIREFRNALAIGTGLGSVWVLRGAAGSDASPVMERLDIVSERGASTIRLPDLPSGSGPCDGCITSFLVGSNSVWVPTGPGDSLLRIDPAVDRTVATIDLGRDVGSVVESPDGYIWVTGGGSVGAGCDPAAGYVAVIDPSTNRIIRDTHIACAISLVVHGEDVWVGIDGPTGPRLEQIAHLH
jgi:DNA-binding beta-propeller fold protein YncE